MYFTQEQVDTIQLPIRGKRLKLEVLNTDFQTLATLEGIAVGGSLQKDATAFVRRSGTIQMCVPNVASADTFIDYVEGITINVNGKIWLDKYVKVWTGIDNYNQPYGEEPKTVWYNFGICLIDQPVRGFSSEGYTMTFNLIDLSAKLNGDRAGQLAITTTLFPRIVEYGGENITIWDNSTELASMYIDDGIVYLGGNGYIYWYNTETKEYNSTQTPYNGITYALSGDNQNVYCGGANAKFAVFNKETKTFGEEITTNLNGRVYGIANSSSYVLIAGIGGFCKYYKSTGIIGNLTTPSFVDVYSICVGNDQKAYMGGENGNAIIYNLSTSTFGTVLNFSEINNKLEHCTQDDLYVYFVGGNQIGRIEKSTGWQEGDGSIPFSAGEIRSITWLDNYLYCGAVGENNSSIILRIGTRNGLTPVFINQSPWDGYVDAIGNIGGSLYCGTSNGQFGIYQAIPKYTLTSSAIAACIELTEFKRYTIYPIPDKWKYLPYDIKIEVGGTIYSALEQFLNILNGWQMYFDNEGVFTVEPIPSGANDIVYPFNLQLNVSDTNSVDFNNVRNQVIVYGKSHNVQTIGNLTSEIVNYHEKAIITYQNLQLDKLYVGAILGFQQTFTPLFWFDNSDIQQMVTIKYTDSGGVLHTLQTDIPVYKYGMDEIETSARRKHIYFAKYIYVIRIKDATTIENQDGTRTIDFSQPISLELLGRLQSQANIVNGNPESPYYINRAYTGKSHYAEFYSAVENTALNKLVLYYRITDKADDILQGDILTLTCPIPTKEYAQLELRVTGDNIGLYVGGLVSNDYSNVGEDYTIWEFVFDGTNYVLKGRCPYANPLILSGGEFDNIYADSLAEERAEYELFLHSNMQNTITLGCVPDYALDVNYRIKYNQSSALPPDAVIDESFEDKYFITKQVTYPLGLDGSAQTVNAIEIYDDFNYVGYAYDLPTGT